MINIRSIYLGRTFIRNSKTSPRIDCPWFISLNPPLSVDPDGPPVDAFFYDVKNSCRSSRKLSDSKDTDKASHLCADLCGILNPDFAWMSYHKAGMRVVSSPSVLCYGHVTSNSLDTLSRIHYMETVRRRDTPCVWTDSIEFWNCKESKFYFNDTWKSLEDNITINILHN